MANPSPTPEKAELRRTSREALDGLPAGDRASLSGILARRIAGWLEGNPGRTLVAVYAATASEPDLGELHDLCRGIEFCYPSTGAGGSMEFCVVTDREALVPGRYGIREPQRSRHPIVAPAELDVIVCPGLAFDRRGVRLGRGGGYYDRYLARLPASVPRLGVGFPVQMRDDLIADGHDVAMTHLVTESGVVEVASP